MKTLRSMALAAVFASILTASADAGLIITGVDTTIEEGGTGAVTFTIETDGIASEPDLSPNDFLNFFQSSFQITTVASTGGRLEFSDTMLPPVSDLDYVFSGISTGQTVTNPVFNPQTVVAPNDTLLVFDSTLIAAPPAPPFPLFATLTPTGGSRLLARLQLTTLGPLAPAEGDTFNVTITPTVFQGPSAPNFFSLQSDFTATVEIIAATTNVIPEPASALSWSMVCVLGLARRRRR